MSDEPGAVRRALLNLEPWILGGIIVFPMVLSGVRWAAALFQ